MFINSASIYFEFFICSATIISLCLSPVMFYLFFAQTDQFTVSVKTKGKKKVQESEVMFTSSSERLSTVL